MWVWALIAVCDQFSNTRYVPRTVLSVTLLQEVGLSSLIVPLVKIHLQHY